MTEEKKVDLEPFEEEGTQVYGTQPAAPPQQPAPQQPELAPQVAPKPRYLKAVPRISLPHLALVAGISTSTAIILLIIISLFMAEALGLHIDLLPSIAILFAPMIVYLAMGYLAKVALSSNSPLLLHVGTILSVFAPAVLTSQLIYAVAVAINGDVLGALAYAVAWWIILSAFFKLSDSYQPPVSSAIIDISSAFAMYVIEITVLVIRNLLQSPYFGGGIYSIYIFNSILQLLNPLVIGLIATFLVFAILWFIVVITNSRILEELIKKTNNLVILIVVAVSIIIGVPNIYRGAITDIIQLIGSISIFGLAVWILVIIYKSLRKIL